MANPNINKPADVELVFGVKGGGSVSGESGSRILSELRSIVDEINKNHTLEIEFKASDKSLKTGSKSHKKTIKDIKDEADKASMSVFKMNTLLRSAVLQQNNIGKSIAQIDLKNMGLSEADTKAVEAQLVKLANITEKLNALKSSKGANVGNVLIEKNALVKEGREIEAEIERIIRKTTEQKTRLDALLRLGATSKSSIAQLYKYEAEGKIPAGTADRIGKDYSNVQNYINKIQGRFERGKFKSESELVKFFNSAIKAAVNLNNEVDSIINSVKTLNRESAKQTGLRAKTIPVNTKNKSTLESLLGYKPIDIDKALKTVDITKLTNDQKKGFLDLGSQVDTCKTKFKELLQSSDLFSEESFNDVMTLRDAFTKLIESIGRYSNIANNTKTNTVANEQVKKQVEDTTSYYTSEVNRMLKNVDPSKLQNKDGTLSEGWIKASQAANQYLLEIKAIANSSTSMDAETQALIQAKINEFATITDGLKSFQREAKTSYASLQQVESLYKKLDNYVKANPRIKGTNEYESIVSMRDQLKEQIDLKDNITITRDQIRGMNDDFARYDRILGEANKKGNTFVGWVKEGYKRFGGWSLITRTMMSMIRMFKTMISNIKTLDSAMTELKKVTSETSATYEKFLSNATVRAKNLGVTVSDIVNATADFARLGYSISDAEALADAATVYKNVGDGIEDINQASESIISTMQAFGISAENAMNIVDKFNTVGNKFAISSTGVGVALQKSASSMEAANNTLDETIALITAANTILQNPETVGKVMPNNTVMY